MMQLKQRTKQVSKTESLQLVLSLFRMSIFQICYLRRMFPENYFSSRRLKSLENTCVQVLSPTTEESRRLIDWVESGAADAIKRQYLKRLFFGISNDAEGTDLIEFTVGYSNDNVKFKLASSVRGKDRSSNGIDIISAEQVRREWLKILRMLISLCVSLDDVPPERHIFIKMTYYDHCPEDYEPPFFTALDPSKVGRFSREPFRMSVGKLNTPHHEVMLKCKTLLDRSEEQEEDYETDSVAEEESLDGTSLISQDQKRNTMTTVTQQSQDLMQIEEVSQQDPVDQPTSPDDKENVSTDSRSVNDNIFQKVLDICSCLSHMTEKDIRLKLPNVSEEKISNCVCQLLRLGVFVRSYRPNTFIVERKHEYFSKDTSPNQLERKASLLDSSLEGRIGSNGADSARTDSVVKSRESTYRFHTENHSSRQSLQSNTESKLKSLALSSSEQPNKPMDVSPVKSKDNEFSFLPTSQETINETGRIRKASFVEDPITIEAMATKKRCTRQAPMISRMKS